MTEGVASRVKVVEVLVAVLGRGHTLDAALAAVATTPQDRAWVQAIAFGTLRFGHRLSRVASGLVSRPWDAQSPTLRALLLLGLYQLEYAEMPPHAAVSTTVAAARAVGEARAAGLVNACLRRFQRERGALLDRADATLAGRWSHPEWLVEAYRRDWPKAQVEILAANNEHPPLTLRINPLRTSREALMQELADLGHRAHPVDGLPQALVLERPLDVRQWSAFQEGRCSVQDAAAQCAAPLLDARAGMRVLDACAAPGGKTGHLCELTPQLKALVALDLDAARAARITDNLHRLGLHAVVRVGDALDPTLLQGEFFDRILLDAPCSGTGVIRRHPDIKWLRRPTDLGALAARQSALLSALWPRLAPGGRLVYATCSVLKAENREVIQAFLRERSDAVDVSESASLALDRVVGVSRAAGPGLALLPGPSGMDGFYYACLERRDRH